MAIALTGTGGFFTRFGAFAKTWIDVDAARGSATDTRISTLAAQFLSNEQAVFADIWGQRDNWRAAGNSQLQDLFTMAANTLIAQADRDTVFAAGPTITDAVAELVRQMIASSDSLNRPTLGATVTANGSNVGNTTVVTTTTDGDAKPLDCLFAETMTVRVTAANAAAAFSETLGVVGDPAANSADYNWPWGSGTNSSVGSVDPALTTLILNGGFETWTVSNVPDNWTITTGTAGVQVLQGASPRRGTYDLRLVSDGSTLTKLRQAPAVTLSPLTVYAVTLTAKIDTITGTGALRLALVDASGTVVNDAAGNANALSLGLNAGSGVAATYAQFTAFFRTPAKVSADWKLEIGFTTSPGSGRIVDIDLIGMAVPTQLYAGGPHLIAWGNSVTPIVGDSWSIAYTNSLGNTSLVRSADRAFGTRQMGLKFPTSGSPTVSDSLIS